MTNKAGPKKVAILGGGMAALTVAFELTSRPDWKQEFSEITVYQPGWRLGGKGAGGRNQDTASRIEERGLHVWTGFYENAFRLLRACYQELKREARQPLSSWQEAVLPQELLVIDEYVDGKWKPWIFRTSPDAAFPGDSDRPPSPWDYLALGVHSVRGWWTEISSIPCGMAVEEKQPPPPENNADKLDKWTEEWVNHAHKYMSHLDAAVRATEKAEPLATTALAILDQVHRTLTSYVKVLPETDDRVRRLWIQMDLTLTAARGALRDRVPFEGFDVLDGADFREWLRRHGAAPVTLESALLTGLYDFVFASVNADPKRQNLAAGVALRLLSRLAYNCKGSRLWKLPAGMGDAVFAPLYEVLKKRGVRFRFFHRVAGVRLEKDRKRVSEIRLERQATIKGDYEPLISAHGAPAWPGAPRYELLAEGESLKQKRIDLESVWADWKPVEVLSLRVGDDFDVAVLGISLAALPHVCPDLIAAEPQWQKMVGHVATVQTVASQLWFNVGLKKLGWDLPPPFLTAFDPPLATWSDLPESISLENWEPPKPPRSVAYLRGTMSDATQIPSPGPGDFPRDQLQRAQELALSWFATKAVQLWPGLRAPTGKEPVHWEYLAAPANVTAAQRFYAQHHRANVEPSDRYVQSPAGTTQYRIDPARTWFGNLYVCGDWTKTLLNVGCIEAAVMSGMQAASALRGQPVSERLKRDW